MGHGPVPDAVTQLGGELTADVGDDRPVSGEIPCEVLQLGQRGEVDGEMDTPGLREVGVAGEEF